MIKFQDVIKSYNHNNVVDHLNLNIDKGKLVTLIGPSGCGKTTSLKMINRLIEPTAGKIFIRGEDIMKHDPIELRRGIGYVIQQISLFPNMTIGKNIAVTCKLSGWSSEKAKNRAAELLQMVDMDPGMYMDRYPKELSGGQQQRIGVIRALAAEPDIILMDEPFGALDPITRDQLQSELIKIQKNLQKTIVFVTHDMDEAIKLADNIVLMKEGKLVQLGTPDELLRNPANSFVSNFFGNSSLFKSPDEIMVEEVMISAPVKIEYYRGLAEALIKMKKHHVDSLMVEDSKGIFLGVASAKALQKQYGKDLKVGDLLENEPVVVHVGQSVHKAVSIMSQNNVGYLPVLDDKNKLVGLITRSSLVNILTDFMWTDIGSDGNTDEDKEVE